MLKGKGLTKYLSLNSEQKPDYHPVRSVILEAYKIAPNFYCQKFHNSHKNSNETYGEYAHEMKKYLSRWLFATNIKDYGSVCELILLEQFCRGIPQDIKFHVLKKEVSTLAKAIDLAENYSLMHRRANNFSHPRSPSQPASFSQGGWPNTGFVKGRPDQCTSKICFYCNEEGHIKLDYPKLKGRQGSESRAVANVGKSSHFQCYYCREIGHIAMDCPKLKNKRRDDRNKVASVVRQGSIINKVSSKDSFSGFRSQGVVSRMGGVQLFR